MLSKTQTSVTAVFSRLQKLNTRIINLRRNGAFFTMPFYKRASLLKRYKRYLKKLIMVEHPLSKATGLFAIAMLISSGNHAQTTSCKRYKDALQSNPLKIEQLPGGLKKPAFVDIDNDGDMDCYAISSYAGNTKEFKFFKNTGSNKFPVFEMDGTGSFPTSPDITASYFYYEEGPVFADIDGDGDYDCFISNYIYGDYRLRAVFFENVGDKNNPVFIQQPDEKNPLNFVRGYRSLYFNLVDIDADGDYDLYKFESYYDIFYENKGTKNNPDFVFIKDINEGHVGFSNPYFDHYIFTDWNKDGLIDALKEGDNYFYKNNGTLKKPHFVKDYTNGPKFTGTVTAYAMTDLNNDGFPEFFDQKLGYATVAPDATIAAKDIGSITRLDAYPKGALTYQWSRNGKRIANATKDFIRVSQAGSYTVEITRNCGTGLSLPYELKNTAGVASATGGENLSMAGNKNISLQFYPNPFTNECIVQFGKNITGKTTVHVTDAQGRLVISMNANNNTRFGKELKPGAYFVQVIQNNHVVFLQKLVKQ